jgi:hypothetical protein
LEEAVLEYQETIRLKRDYSATHRGRSRALQTKKKIEAFVRRL